MDKEILRGRFEDHLFEGDEALYIQGDIEALSAGYTGTLRREIDSEISEDRLEIKPVIFEGPLPIGEVLTVTMANDMVKFFIGDLRAILFTTPRKNPPFAVYLSNKGDHIFDQSGRSHSEDVESTNNRVVELGEIPNFEDKASMPSTLLDDPQKELLDLQ